MYKVEKEFDYQGYHCLITFNEIGYMCGYIAVPEDNYFYDKRFAQINDERILSIPLSYAGTVLPREDGHYWIGFTCDERGDKPDVNRVKEIWGEKAMVLTFLNMQKLPILPKTGTIRTVEYVEEKIKRLVSEVQNENRRQNT